MSRSVVELGINGLRNALEMMGEPSFRAKQIWNWVVSSKEFDFQMMTNLPKELRLKLERDFTTLPLNPKRVIRSKYDNTIKFVSELKDDNLIETVVLKYEHGHSVCISSQIGCRMGCQFCASTIGGLVRDCTVGEMMAQVLLSSKLADTRISHVVVMGIGEPLENYDNLVGFLRLCIDKNQGLAMSARHLTVSTCGIVPAIYDLAREKLPITLAISLHAPTNELRSRIMPIAQLYSLKELIKACQYYFDVTGRRVTFEYIMIRDINDSLSMASELARLLKGFSAHVNLIPLNQIAHRDWLPSDMLQVEKFRTVLHNTGISVTVRRQLGADIDAACGQLRRKLSREKR